MPIDHANLAKLDLNLLVAFDALMSEGAVTRAAAKVGLGQSAMSHTLGRLRTTFDDELFVRTPTGMRPTPKAAALAEPVRAALAQMEAIMAPPAAFDPLTARRSFTIGLPDSTEMLLVPRLVAHLSAVAPGVDLLIRSIDRIRILDDLDSGRVDLGIGLFEDGAAHHKRRLLHRDNYVCIFNPALVGVEPPISLEDYVRLPHVLTSLVESAHGVVDDALGKLGLTRRIALTSPRFSAVPFVVREAPVIATMHSRVARFFAGSMGLAISPAPVELPDFAISMMWHASYDNDPAHRWLRETIRRLRANEPQAVAELKLG
ncbi:LysR family transcriptional regulator [Hansschlegelia quercus]|uniref:LysR family transcriptional regulator n=1 Tax=Hansschlegelia quercus TaxID=2528245 RepID=A0A4Q9GS89_9HYPH|nr:LysR family transcriptional regulator [Hansschlegelia quercus]TBN55020.1 LysR family transcriptional regulator [Hansschlegelia quercus]